MARVGIGVESATALLVAAGDNPDRLCNEATFAHLCDVAPIDGSSGKQQRHRLNRGGGPPDQLRAPAHRDHPPCLYDPRTRDYIDRRMKQG